MSVFDFLGFSNDKDDDSEDIFGPIPPKEDRIIDDLDEKELADYEANSDDPKWVQVSENTRKYYTDWMFPDGRDDD